MPEEATEGVSLLVARKESVDIPDELLKDRMRVLLVISLCVLLSPCSSQASCSVKGWCSMSKEELLACRIQGSCDECPLGTCRLPGAIEDTCLCPQRFSSTRAYKALCKKSHGFGSWPLTAGKPEHVRKRCVNVKYANTGKPTAPVPPIAATVQAKCPVKNCSSMTEEELTACRGIHSKCPVFGKADEIVRASCDECPQGSCRVPRGFGTTDVCLCPEYFMTTRTYTAKCAESHGTLA